MKFRRYVTRRMKKARFFSLGGRDGLIGARHNILMQFWARRNRPYRGTFDQHVLMLVKEGTIFFERAGSTFAAKAGDALLIGRGESGRLSWNACSMEGDHDF
jgi:hypothetical protein